MFHWYVINTYSGHENKVKQNLEHRIHSMGQSVNVRDEASVTNAADGFAPSWA
jgi:transcription antitermination factor NusG